MNCSPDLMLALQNLQQRMDEADTYMAHYRTEMILQGIILSTKILTTTAEKK
jgi:hypothetical protein